MIGALNGIILDKRNETLLIMVGGVGYVAYATPTTLMDAKLHAEIFLYIHTVVRENALQLFGFATSAELTLFELLLGVSGIGPKTALHILDRGVPAIEIAIRNADVSFFTAIPRLGTKNAQKLIIELKNKLDDSTSSVLSSVLEEDSQAVVAALTSLGFSAKESLQAVKTIPVGLTSVAEKVTFALKSLGAHS